MSTSYNYASNAFKSLVENLIDADPLNFGHIDPESIIYLNKEEKTPKVVMKITMIKEPYVMLLNKQYILEVSEDLVNKLPTEHTELHMYKILKQIDMTDGKIKYPDVVEFKDVIDKFGYDWTNKDHIPSILNLLNNNSVPQAV
ncbi:hypothetical protein D3C81_753380 [compost metagenome]